VNRVAVGPHRTGLAVWFAAFAGPLAWVTHLLVGYSAEEVACGRATADRGQLFGTDVQVVILVLGIATAALAAVVAAQAAGLDGFACDVAFLEADAEGRGAWQRTAGRR
jgi:hypothetical protein